MSETTPGPHTPAVRTLVAAFVFTLVLAALSNFTIDRVQMSGLGTLASRTQGGGAVAFAFGTLVIWVLVVLVLSVTGQLWLTTGIVAAATVLVAFANYRKLQLRLEPLYPSDLAMGKEVGFLSDMVGGGTTLLLLASVLGILTASVLAGWGLRRVFPPIRRRELPRLSRALLVSRVAGVGFAALVLSYLGQFNVPGNNIRAAYDSHGAAWRAWNQAKNYADNGFVAGVLYNLNAPAMDVPAGYSRAAMARVADKYTALARETNVDRSPHALDDVNVVIVLSETFTDPTLVKGPTFAEDPIPYTRSLMRHTVSGRMLAQMFGGGTANTEFEALTGMSLAQFQPQMTTPYQQLIPKYDDFPSVVGYFEHLGHETIAVHPFMPRMYQRGTVYPILGFDKSVFRADMRARTLDNSNLASDASAFREVLRHLDEASRPALVNLVTMQNHFPMEGRYDHPIGVSGITGEEKAQAGHYARGLRYSDQALKRFLAALQGSNEKTVVVFYGDHQPAFWSEETRDRNGVRATLETPFFVWSNFRPNRGERLPTTSPIYFMNHVLDVADAPLPPFYALLGELEKELPAMQHELMIGPDNRRVSAEDLSARARELLRDYELVQYDLSVGKRYSQGEMFYPIEEDIASASGSGQ